MNTTDYENIWKASLIHVTDEFSLPPVVLQAGEAIIGTLGNFSVSTGKAKAKKTFNVSAIVAAALVNGQVLEYKASFPESKRTILYFDTEQSPYHCQLVMQRILRLAGLPIDREPEYLRFSHLRAIADPNERREIIRYAIYNTPNVGLVVIDGIRDLMLDINNSTEATKLVGDLMQWTSEQNIHIRPCFTSTKETTTREGISARNSTTRQRQSCKSRKTTRCQTEASLLQPSSVLNPLTNSLFGSRKWKMRYVFPKSILLTRTQIANPTAILTMN